MQTRMFFVSAMFVVGVAFGGARPAEASPGDSASCVIGTIEMVASLDVHAEAREDGVAVTVEGSVPPAVGQLVTDVVTEAMVVTGPIRTVMKPTNDGVAVTVRGVSGPLPSGLRDRLTRGVGCVDDALPGAVSNGNDGAIVRPNRQSCAVTAVLPLDASGEVTAAVGEIEGALISVSGPLPVGLEDTAAEVFRQVGAATDDLALQVVQGVRGVQVTVEGIVGPLPVDLSAQLSDAIGCRDAAVPAPSDAEPGAPADPNRKQSGGAAASGSGGAELARGSASGSARGDVSASPLAMTGSESVALGVAGSALVGLGFGLMRLRRLIP